MVQSVFREAVILLPLKGVIDFAAEKERLKKELEGLNKNLEGYARKLSNASFVERAPAAVVEEEKRRQAEALETRLKSKPRWNAFPVFRPPDKQKKRVSG